MLAVHVPLLKRQSGLFGAEGLCISGGPESLSTLLGVVAAHTVHLCTS